MRVLSPIRRFYEDRRGNTALLFSLSLPILIGAVGLGVETGYWYFKQRELQTAADVAAIAGAVEKRNGAVYATIKSSAQSEAVEHGFVTGVGTITVNNPPTSGSNQVSTAVEVLLTMPESRFFSQMFQSGTVTLTARGVAKGNSGGDACILALHDTAAGALTFSGNALALINGCNMMSNSLSSSSLYVGGSAEVTVPCAMSAGGVSYDSGLTLSSCSEPQAYQPQANDPYAATPQPSTAGVCQSFPSGPSSETFSPGRFCGGGPLKGTKHFDPGVYVIDGMDFKINSGATITGSGVTFFLTNNATTDFNGGADITLSAPTSGSYKGILFYGDPDNTSGTSKFNGNASSTMTGIIYAPSQAVEFLGNFSGSNGCMRIVASTIKFTGSTTISSDCTAYGITNAPLPGTVSLVE